MTTKTVIPLIDHIDKNHDGNKRQCAISNGITAQNLNNMLNSDSRNGNNGNRFIIVDGDLYRLAKEGFK